MHRRRRPRRTPVSPGQRRRFLLLVMALVLLGACINGYQELQKLIAVYGENRCRNLVTQMVLDTASQVRSDGKFSSFTEHENKSVVAIDSHAIIQYQAAVSDRLTRKLDELREQVHPVPIGTILGGVLLMERGPLIELRFVPVGSVQMAAESKLQEAGINQVLYRVMLELSVDMTVVLPGEVREIACHQQVILEEVLLTGQVPMAYGTLAAP